MSSAPLPPGSMGLPWLGETAAFGRDPFGFLARRHGRYGPVFKSSLFGRRIAFLSGADGAATFYDPANITREDAHPFPLVQLFGGINMEMFDGPKHAALKAMALEAFSLPALAGYLPAMQERIETTLGALVAGPEFSACARFRTLAIEIICANVLGLAPGPETDAFTRDYGILLPGLVAIPIAIPGTPYGRAVAARDRILARIRALIAQRRRRPESDALSRMLDAGAADGRTYTDAEALLEAHHIVMAGFIVYALMAETVRQLAGQPELLRRCREEVRAHQPSGPVTVEGLSRLSTCAHVVLETKRFVPLVPLAFGRAKRSFDCAGYRIPEDWTVYLTLSQLNKDPAVYTRPDTFDPDRFQRGEHRKHPLAFIPQGAEPPTGHRCLGVDYATFLILTFLTVLVRDYDWDLPEQRLDYNWQTLPPEPRDGLRVRLRKQVKR